MINEAIDGRAVGVARTGNGYAWYTVVILMCAYTFSFLDRQILTLMVGPIERDLGITDTQFALLTGGAFGIFYTFMGLPIGWLADRYPRKWIISIGIALWSLATTLSGVARSFPQLLLARIGVGVGEASLSPSAYSMLSDLFDRTRLPRAMSLYSAGIYIGAGLAMILGGTVVAAIAKTPEVTLPVVGAIRSWQAVFFVVGLPGLAVALWMATLREPIRHGSDDLQERRTFSIARIWAFLSAWPWMSVSLFLGSAMVSVMSYTDSWFPELFIRNMGWDPGRVGHINGTASLVAGPLGMFSAGWLSSRLLSRGMADACIKLTIVAAIGMGAIGVVMPLMNDGTIMAALLFPFKFFGGFTPVLIPSAIQMVSPGALRGQLGAVFMLTVGIVGVTLGPVLPALLSDFVFHDKKLLYLSLAVTSAIVTPIAVLLLAVGTREFRLRATELANA